MYAIFHPTRHSIVFAGEIPERFDGNYVEGVTLDMPPYSDLFRWPVGAARPEVVLCVARDNDKHYKIYKYNNEVELARYRPTGWNFGGFMRPPTPAEQRKARWRAEHAGRWLAWTRGFGEPVGVGETREMALAEAARAGYGDVVCEWVPPGPAAGEAAIS